MRFLTVLYDPRCDLCVRCQQWLKQQPKYVELWFVPAGSPQAKRRFPQLNHDRTLSQLTVISNNGSVYLDAKAWLMCLWALKRYRAWSLTLSTPQLMPAARRFISWVSNNRYRYQVR